MSDGKEKTIRINVENPNPAVDPIVVSFPGGLPQALKDGGGEDKVVPPAFLWQKLNPNSKLGRKVVGSDHSCMYTAQCKGFAYDERRTKLCVGVYDKKRGVLTLHEAASKGTVFSLTQAVPSYQDTIQSQPEMSNLVRRKALFEDFGSSKKRKVLKSQSANMVEIDHVVGAGVGSAVVDKVVKGQSMSESNRRAIRMQAKGGAISEALSSVEAAHAEARRNFLPNYDQTADKPHLVYSAKNIAGDEAWDRLTGEVKACLRQTDVVAAIMKGSHSTDWNASIVETLKEIAPGSRSAKERFTCSLLLNWVINFYVNNHSRRVIKPPDTTKSRFFGIPMEVALRCIELFTTSITNESGTVYAMTKANKDKCLVHALLLYMMTRGTSMKVRNIKPVAADLKITTKEASQILRLAGCKIGSSRGMTSVALEVPLTFPPLKTGGRGRG